MIESPASPERAGDPGDLALVFGARGGLGAALRDRLRGSARYAQVLAGGRGGTVDMAIDITDESSIESAATQGARTAGNPGVTSWPSDSSRARYCVW